MFKSLATSCVFIAALSGGLAQAQANETNFFDAGSILARARFAAVIPENFSSSISVIGGHLQASTADIPELDLSYFLSPNFPVEAIAGTSRHEVSAHYSALGPKADVGRAESLWANFYRAKSTSKNWRVIDLRWIGVQKQLRDQ